LQFAYEDLTSLGSEISIVGFDTQSNIDATNDAGFGKENQSQNRISEISKFTT
jgi:hypothetical protein